MKVLCYICSISTLFLLFFFLLSQKTTSPSFLEQCLTPSTEQWKLLEGQFCEVYYQTEKDTAAAMVRMADTYYPILEKDFSLTDKNKIPFVLFETKEDFTSSFLYEGKQTLLTGAYYDGVIGVLSPSVWVLQETVQTDIFLEKGPIVHEMIHYAVDQKTKGNYTPFLTEGIAFYYEKKYTGYTLPTSSQTSLTKDSLTAAFDTEDAVSAYEKSYVWVNAFVAHYGEGMLQQALSALGKQ